MSAQAAVPITIRASPTHSDNASKSEALRSRAPINTGSTSPLRFAPSPRASPSSSFYSQRSVRSDGSDQNKHPSHNRRQSRIDALAELLLPEPAILASNLGGMSLSSQASRNSHFEAANRGDAPSADELRRKLANVRFAQLLASTESHIPSFITLPENASIESVCEHFCRDSQSGPVLLLQNADQGDSKSLQDRFKGLVSHQDVHVFLCTLFCPSSERSVEQHGLASPPPSPGRGKGEPIGSISAVSHPTTVRISHRKRIQERLKSGHAVPASLVSDLSGTSTVRFLSADTTLDQALQIMGADQVRYLAIVEGGDVKSLLSARDIVGWLIREAKDSLHLSALLDDLAVLRLVRQAVPINSDKTVLDAMSLMNTEGAQSVAVMDQRGALLSPLSSIEVTYEVMRSKSKKILITPLSAFIMALRSQHPEGQDGKDSHPALSIGLSSSVGRAAAVMLTTAAQGIFVLDDMTLEMTPPLSTVSPSSPGREHGHWKFTGDPASEDGKHSNRPSHGRRASASFWTAPRSRTSTVPAQGLPLAQLFGEGPDASPVSAGPVSRSNTAGSFTSASPISAAVGGPGFVRTHRPRSLSLVQAPQPDRTSLKRENSGRFVMAGSISTGTSPMVARSSSGHSSFAELKGSMGAGRVLSPPPSSMLSTSPSSPHGLLVGACALADAAPLAQLRFYLDFDSVLGHVARSVGLLKEA